MKTYKIWSTACIVFIVANAAAQTTVTTTGGTASTVPVFTGSSTLGSSVITQSGGNVGIGTGTPEETLDVFGTIAAAPISNATGTSGWFMEGRTTADEQAHDINAVGLGISIDNGAANAYSLTFGVNPPWPTEQITERMRITSNGYVGIGTTSPLSALTLAGANSTNPNTGPQLDYNGENITFENTNGAHPIGGIKMVQPTGYFVDAGDMVLSTSYGGLIERMRLTALGNVGIGTTSPGASLEVNGSVKLTAGSGAAMTFQDGSVQTVAWNGVLPGGDYAESVDVGGDRTKYEPGDVLVIDPASEGHFLKSGVAYSTSVTGVYSTRPGVVGRRQKTDRAQMKDEVPMAMTGIVPVKVSAENGPVRPGDLLVTASTPGYAMKGTDRAQMLGAVIGKALGHLDAGTGVVEAVVTLQ
jgi:hypothetical protein